MTRKNQIAKSGAKRRRNWESAPPMPGSAARRTGLTNRHSIKVEPRTSGIWMRNPAADKQDLLGSGFPGSLQECKRLRLHTHLTVEFRELSKQERLPDFAHGVKVK